TYRTDATDEKTLRHFYTHVRPAGFWGPVAKEVEKLDGGIPARTPFTRDLLNVVLGIPWLSAMWMCPIYLVLHRFTEAYIAGGMVLVLSCVLYWTWYRTLEKD
ncbi:MAG: sodium:solute symporter, partial [Armatimonadetes bacterium]|nr:sodium:solute symporter [Armatimonadota bacterium]